MSSIFDTLKSALASNQLVALATIVAGRNAGEKQLVWPDGRVLGDLGDAALNQQVLDSAIELLSDQKTGRRVFEIEGEVADIFIEVFPPPPRLIAVGAVHITVPLVRFASELGFHTTVIDARSAFATPERFAHADRLILKWPDDALAALSLDEGCYIAVLSHDDKLDVPALKVALQSKARYIGALGSRKTMAGRAQKLRDMGVSDEQLARIHNPIGLNLGGRRPEEIALAIMAEIVAVQNGTLASFMLG
jgi:xanthine dehydrogenase accessory factor